jgi:hypothetical protein
VKVSGLRQQVTGNFPEACNLHPIAFFPASSTALLPTPDSYSLERDALVPGVNVESTVTQEANQRHAELPGYVHRQAAWG